MLRNKGSRKILVCVFRRHAATGSGQAVLQHVQEIRTVECDLFNSVDHKWRQESPEKRRAWRPCRDQQQPGVERRVPKTMDSYKMIKPYRWNPEERCLSPQLCNVYTAACENHAADDEHQELRGNCEDED